MDFSLWKKKMNASQHHPSLWLNYKQETNKKTAILQQFHDLVIFSAWPFDFWERKDEKRESASQPVAKLFQKDSRGWAFPFKAGTLCSQKAAVVNSTNVPFESDKLPLSQQQAEPAADVRSSLGSSQPFWFCPDEVELFFRSELAGRGAEARESFLFFAS